MTPLQIKMMLHHYAIAEPYALREPEHRNSQAVADQLQDLLDKDLLIADDKCGSGYACTSRGQAYVDLLCRMPLPIQQWVPAGTAFRS